VNADLVEYSCNGSAWQAFQTDSFGEQSFGPLTNNLTCRFQARNSLDPGTPPVACSAPAELKVNVIPADTISCLQSPESSLTNFTLTSSFTASATNLNKLGQYFIRDISESCGWLKREA
jgi:hypothetical protein